MSYFKGSGADLYKLWQQAVRNRDSMGETVLEMLCCPAATPEHILDAAAAYAKVSASLRAQQPRVASVLEKKGQPHFANLVRTSLSRSTKTVRS